MFKREPFGVLLNLGYLLGKLEWTANDNSRPTYLHLKQLLHILKTYPGELDEFVGLWAALDMLEKHQQTEPRSRVPERLSEKRCCRKWRLVTMMFAPRTRGAKSWS